MAKVEVRLKGGKPEKVAAGTTAAQALSLLDAEAARRAVAVRIGQRLADLSSTLGEGDVVEPIFEDSPEGLEILRHSTAHLMAQAVMRLFADVQVTIGPTVEDGFYYDFEYSRPFTAEDLEAIERTMGKIARADLAISREEMSRSEAAALFSRLGQRFKVEIIEGLDEDRVSLYRQGEFVDLCRGPHLPSTGRIKAFKLLRTAGAYWRGDEKNARLQRIYGTAFFDQHELEEYLALLEEAKKRDHRRLGKDLDLFSFHPQAPASPFFHPRGAIVYNTLVELMRRLYTRFGYQEVITPQILDVDLWRRSGHYDHYRENMYFARAEDRELAVKPMNCPAHCLMFSEKLHSYRDLPLRYADFGRLHRFERSGVVAGLTRVRSFSQDDAHIFCTTDQVEDEIVSVMEMLFEVYRLFGFREIRTYLSTQPEQAIGSRQVWERAEAALMRGLERKQIAFALQEGEGAFYGPKIDFCVLDAMKREWQLGTIQLDFSMPERFDLHYIDSEGNRRRPVMIHRALLGSIERFMGILLEHTAGALPFFLAPEQVRIVTVTDKQLPYAREVLAALRREGIRAALDERSDKLGYKIREAELQKVPYVLVLGDKEVESRTVAARPHRGKPKPPVPLAEFLREVAAEANFGQGGVQ